MNEYRAVVVQPIFRMSRGSKHPKHLSVDWEGHYTGDTNLVEKSFSRSLPIQSQLFKGVTWQMRCSCQEEQLMVFFISGMFSWK